MSVAEKFIVKRTRRGNVLTISREHYLRDDLPCSLSKCMICPKPLYGIAKGQLTGANVCYIPDASALLNQTDFFESTDTPIKETIILQTVLKTIKAQSTKLYNRVKNQLAKCEPGFVFFNNEHRKETFMERISSDSDQKYDSKSVLFARDWLKLHWNIFKIDIVVLTDTINLYPDSSQVVSISDFVNRHKESFPKICEVYVPRDEDHDDAVMDQTDDTGTATPQQTASTMKKSSFFYESFLSEKSALNRISSGSLFSGTFHVNPYNFREASVSVSMDVNDRDKKTKVILSGRKDQNRAIEGDVVAVELYSKSKWKTTSNVIMQTDDVENFESDSENNEHVVDKEEHDPLPTGRVVAILKRNWRPVCGTIEPSYTSGDSAFFIPVDRRIPRIRIKSNRLKELLNMKLVVTIDAWSKSSLSPNGHIIREVGEAGDKASETEVLLLENQIPHSAFGEDVMACLPGEDWHVTEDMLENRLDLRDRIIASIDPPGCTDIDDALHCVKISDNEYEVGIHIADVTAFVKHGTALDNEGRIRGTSVYLVDKRIEMLPSLLTSKLCSIQGEVERLAFSVLLRMDKDGNIIRSDFRRTVIKSRAALTYAAAQERLDAYRIKIGKGNVEDDPISQSIYHLATLAKKLRDKRMDAGALTLASPEVKFKIEEATSEVTDVAIYETRETNRLVEEYMLLANIEVAKKILTFFPKSSLLRRHPVPSVDSFEPLLAAAKSIGVDLDVSSSKRLNDTLDETELKLKRQDPYMGTLLRILATRCMTQAVYFSSGSVPENEYVHYGLAAPIYTHFTSPIRRYADVIVHRLLSSCMGYSTLPKELQSSSVIENIADVINERHRSAQYASRASILLHTVLLFKNKEIEEDGRIIRVLKNGVVVLVPRYGVEGIAYVQSRDSQDVAPVFSQKEQTLKVSSDLTYKILGHVRVRIRVEESTENRDRVLFELKQS